MAGQIDCARWLLKQPGIRLEPEMWAFCRSYGQEELLREGLSSIERNESKIEK